MCFCIFVLLLFFFSTPQGRVPAHFSSFSDAPCVSCCFEHSVSCVGLGAELPAVRAFRLGWGTWCGVCPRWSTALLVPTTATVWKLPLLLARVTRLMLALHCVLKSQPQPLMVCPWAPALSLFLRCSSPSSLSEVVFRNNIKRMSL